MPSERAILFPNTKLMLKSARAIWSRGISLLWLVLDLIKIENRDFTEYSHRICNANFLLKGNFSSIKIGLKNESGVLQTGMFWYSKKKNLFCQVLMFWLGVINKNQVNTNSIISAK